MKLYQTAVEVQSDGGHPTFHNVTEQLKKALADSGIKNGQVTVYSHHTTCSVLIQEQSHDKTFFGLEYLQQDMCDIMERLIPSCRVEGQYRHYFTAAFETVVHDMSREKALGYIEELAAFFNSGWEGILKLI